MKKVFGLFTILALVTGSVVLSDEVKSIVERNTSQDAVQAVESAINDSANQSIPEEALPVDEALPEQEALPDQSEKPVLTPAEAIDNALPETSQESQSGPATQYILGVITSPIPPMVRAQINLPEESGLFVQTIKPNGPAAKAGVQPYDIIIAIDGAAISNTNDLSSKIQSAAGKPQKLTVLRHGKELTLDIVAQPAEASHQPRGLFLGAPGMPAFINPMDPNYDPDEDDAIIDPRFPKLQQFMERQRHQMENMRQRMEAMENAMRQGMPGFMPFAPGAVPAPVPTPAPDPNAPLMLPQQQPLNNPNAQVQSDTFSVQVQKNGNDPAIIKIQENGNEYTVDENSIDQLPENVRNRLNFKIQTNDK